MYLTTEIGVWLCKYCLSFYGLCNYNIGAGYMWATLVNSKECRFVMAEVYSVGVLLHKVSLDAGRAGLE